MFLVSSKPISTGCHTRNRKTIISGQEEEITRLLPDYSIQQPCFQFLLYLIYNHTSYYNTFTNVQGNIPERIHTNFGQGDLFCSNVTMALESLIKETLRLSFSLFKL